MPSSADPVQVNNFLNNGFVINAVSQHKEFKLCFVFEDPQKPIPACKLCPNWEFYPFVKHIWYVLHFAWLLGCDISIDEQTIGFKVRHVDRIRISYKNEGCGFKVDAIYYQGYT